MGHHIWKIILSKSVFTRVTDGRRLLCYSVYVVSGVAVVSAVALSLHYFVVAGRGGTTPAEGDASGSDREVGWECLAGFYIPVSALLLVNVFFYWTAQRTMAKQMLYNRSMQHFQVNFDLYIKFLLVEGVWWLFFMLSLLPVDALTWISRVFDVVHGPLVFCVAMCRTRVAYLFKKYFCHDGCCFGCCSGGGEFIDEADGGGQGCQELSVIDRLREKADQEEEEEDDGEAGLASRVTTALLAPISMPSARNGRDEMSRSLFNVRNNSSGAAAGGSEVPPPANTELPLGRVKRLLKSNSMTAIANINFGWRRETSV